MRILLITALVLGMTFCSSDPAPEVNNDSTDITESVDRNAAILNEAGQLVEEGSLSSLKEALSILSSESAGQTEQGARLKFVAGSLAKIVFPYAEVPGAAASDPKYSLLSDISAAALQGRIMEVAGKDASYFGLMISSTAALRASSDAVFERSLDIINTVYDADPDKFLPLYVRAVISEKRKLYQEALKGYEAALERDGSSYPAELGRVRILLRFEEYSRALPSAESLAGKYPEVPEILYLYADSLIGVGSLDRAQTVVSSRLAANPDDMIMTLKYAGILEKQNKDQQALRILKIIEDSIGKTAMVYRLRASILIKQGRFDEAYGFLEEGVAEYPDNTDLRTLYGKVLLLTGRNEEGRDYLENDLEVNPEGISSLKLLTEEAVASENWARAEELVVRLVSRSDQDENLRYAVTVYRNRNKPEKASEYSLKIIRNGNPVKSDYTTYIEILMGRNMVSEAKNMIDSWLADSSSPSWRSHFYYLQSLTETEPEQKLESLRQSLFENLQNLEAMIAIADVYEATGELRKAYRYLKQALILSPDNISIKNRLRSLEGRLNQ